MLRHALRRLLWIVPILIGVTLASFALLSYVPDPADDPAVIATLARRPGDRAQALAVSRFAALFQRAALRRRGARRCCAGASRRGTTTRQLGATRRSGASLPLASSRCARSGGARAGRGRTLAGRRTNGHRVRAGGRSRAAVAFWNRFWADRGIDFRTANARRAARRLSVHGTSTREADLIELDTFALEQIMVALDELAAPAAAGDRRPLPPKKESSLCGDSSRPRLTSPNATTRSPMMPRWPTRSRAFGAGASGGSCTRPTTSRTAAALAFWRCSPTRNTRGGPRRSSLLGFGTSEGARPHLAEAARSRSAHAHHHDVGADSRVRAGPRPLGRRPLRSRASPIDVWILSASLLLFAIPTACLAVLLARRGAVGSGFGGRRCSRWGSSFLRSRQSRALLAQVNRSDYIRHAHALGMGPVRIAFRHALRNAALAARGSGERRDAHRVRRRVRGREGFRHRRPRRRNRARGADPRRGVAGGPRLRHCAHRDAHVDPRRLRGRRHRSAPVQRGALPPQERARETPRSRRSSSSTNRRAQIGALTISRHRVLRDLLGVDRLPTCRSTSRYQGSAYVLPAITHAPVFADLRADEIAAALGPDDFAVWPLFRVGPQAVTSTPPLSGPSCRAPARHRRVRARRLRAARARHAHLACARRSGRRFSRSWGLPARRGRRARAAACGTASSSAWWRSWACSRRSWRSPWSARSSTGPRSFRW